MTSEDQITYCVKEYLLSKNWDILFYNPPGGQGGFFWGDPNFSGGGSQGSKIVDMICFQNNNILVIESKPKFNLSDKNKLDTLFSSLDRMKLFRSKLGCHCEKLDIKLNSKKSAIWKSLAFSGNMNEIPDDYVFFLIQNENVLTYFGSNIPKELCTIL